MAESTLHFYINNIMNFLNDIAKSIIQFPETLEEKTKVSREFQNVNNINYIIYIHVLNTFSSDYLKPFYLYIFL